MTNGNVKQAQQQSPTLGEAIDRLSKKGEYLLGRFLKFRNKMAIVMTNLELEQNNGDLEKRRYLVALPSKKRSSLPHAVVLQKLEDCESPASQEQEKRVFDEFVQFGEEGAVNPFVKGDSTFEAFTCKVLGVIRNKEDDSAQVEFTNDASRVRPRYYNIYAMDEDMLDIVINQPVTQNRRDVLDLGKLSISECRSLVPGYKQDSVTVKARVEDFLAKISLVVGIPGQGKSNGTKYLVRGIDKAVKRQRLKTKITQLIADPEGEYARKNDQDGGRCLRDELQDWITYGFVEEDGVKPITPDFYRYPKVGFSIICSILSNSTKRARYIDSILAIPDIPSIEEIEEYAALNPEDYGALKLMVRPVLIYWAWLKASGFEISAKFEESLPNIVRYAGQPYQGKFGLGLAEKERRVPAYEEFGRGLTPPQYIGTLYELVTELKIIAQHYAAHDKKGKGRQDKESQEFTTDTATMLRLLDVGGNLSGSEILKPARELHKMGGGEGTEEIVETLARGTSVILNLSRCNDKTSSFFMKLLCTAVLKRQEGLFNNNEVLDDILIYLEEAQRILPYVRPEDQATSETVYNRMAREGRKFHIGLICITQTPTAIDERIRGLAKNYIVGKLTDKKEIKALVESRSDRLAGYEDDIIGLEKIGHMLAFMASNRFAVPIQFDKLELGGL